MARVRGAHRAAGAAPADREPAAGAQRICPRTLARHLQEIGIRIALGAAGHDVRRLVVSQTLWPTLIGISVGLAAAAMLTRLVASFVYGVTPLDLATFAVGVVALENLTLQNSNQMSQVFSPRRRRGKETLPLASGACMLGGLRRSLASQCCTGGDLGACTASEPDRSTSGAEI